MLYPLSQPGSPELVKILSRILAELDEEKSSKFCFSALLALKFLCLVIRMSFYFVVRGECLS